MIDWILEKRKLNELVPYETADTGVEDRHNPRLRDPKGYAELKKSIDTIGMAQAINIARASNVILSGHQRVGALIEKYGPEHEVDCYVSSRELLEQEMRDCVILLNKATAGVWDLDYIAENWDKHNYKDYGFEKPDQGKIGLTDDDSVPEVKESFVNRGDIYQIGGHRVMCGDSTDGGDVALLMDGKKADMCFTSPPYWVGFEYENEDDKKGILEHIEKATKVMVTVSEKIVINTGNISSITKAEKITGKRQPALLIDWWINEMNRNNYMLRHIRIWAKYGGVKPSRRSENLKAGQNIGTPEWAVKGVWTDIKGSARQSNHVAAFPVELAVRYIMMYSKSNGLVYEPYCGSGSTLIACEKTGRICYGMEIDPNYCAVIIKRFEEFSGIEAVKL